MKTGPEMETCSRPVERHMPDSGEEQRKTTAEADECIIKKSLDIE